MQIIDYIKPELLIVSVVLYFFNRAIKQSKIFDCKYIPLVNGVAGIFVCGIYVVSASPINTGQQFGMALFTAITQGILVSGISTYVNKFITNEGKIDFKGAFRSDDAAIDPQKEIIKDDVLRTIKRDMKREIKNDIENDVDEETGCNLKCDIKREITENLKSELMSEIENELIDEIQDELLGDMKGKETAE